ncbi:MAG TPA: STAS domain-containing protein [bacterium]|nr:STAS domain-containing protein [bacterium]
MNIDVVQQGDVQIMRCGGSLDADTVAAFKKVAYDLVGGGSTRFVVDCTDLKFIDSMGLGVLISLLRRVRSRDGDVKVAGLSEEVKTIFEITRLHRLFDVCADSNTAIRQFNKKT